MLIQGKVVNIIDRDVIIGRFPQPIPLGSKVVDNRSKNLGVAYTLLGPVDNPYVEIRVQKRLSNPISMIDRGIYVEVK